MNALFRISIVFVMLFLAPIGAAAAWWSTVDRPVSWRNADWGSSGLFANDPDIGEPVIYIMAARTGGFKGAFSVHSWIVTKRAGQSGYDRYDKLGWGRPVRKNHRAADAYWYSNQPRVIAKIEGDKAAALIPLVENAIADYPFSAPGDYRIWPGPNSNTFVAHVLRQVPQLGVVLPPHAVGRNYLGDGTWYMREADGSDTHLSAFGLIGISYGQKSGFEINFMGQTVGIDFRQPAIKLPAFGRVELPAFDS